MTFVLGGGLSGLSAAYYLSKKKLEKVTLFEASNRLGGWIESEKHGGFIFEKGPRTIRPKGKSAANTLQLIEEIDLEQQLIPILANHSAAKNRMIYANKELHLLPTNLNSLLRKTKPFSRPLLFSILSDILKPKSNFKLDDESIFDFVDRRFGKEIAEYAISSLICGVCAGDAKEISVRFLMNDVFEQEQKYGSVIKGMLFNFLLDKKKTFNNIEAQNSKLFKKAKNDKWSIYSFREGLETLPNKLADILIKNNVKLNTNAKCSKLNLKKNEIVLEVNGKENHAKSIISALPSYVLSDLVRQQYPELANLLNSIPYVSVAVVNIMYDIPDLLKKKAFGFLVPPNQNLPILGIIYDSCCFDIETCTVITVMMGGKWFKEYFGENPTEEYITKIALEQINSILNIKNDPKLIKVNILEKCIPQYTLGHFKRIEEIRKYISKENLPLKVCGAAYDGVGVNDVILSAKMAVYNT